MKSSALTLGLLSTLILPGPLHALAHVLVGNQPLGPEFGFQPEILAVLNTEERVYLIDHEAHLWVYFKGGPRGANEAIRRFAAIPAAKREIVLLPAPAKPIHYDKEPIAYDWCLHIPRIGGRRHVVRDSEVDYTRTTLTIYIPEPLPPAPADPKAARRWIADLDSDTFKTRDRAARELAALGTPVAGLIREALAGKPSAEVRARLESILADMSRDLRLDVLNLPAGVPVVGVDDLLARGRRELTNKNPDIRGDAAGYLADQAAPAEEILPDLEKVLKTEKAASPLAGAAWGAYRLGAAARPLLPTLRETQKTADKDIAGAFARAIEQIEKTTADPVPEAEIKRRAMIRKEIREFLAGKERKVDRSVR